MSNQPEVNTEALDAGYKVELRQQGADILYVFVSPQLIESELFETAADAWQAAYHDLHANALEK